MLRRDSLQRENLYRADWWLYISKPPEKADVKDDSVYLTTGTRGRGKATGYTGWCAREAVFVNRWGGAHKIIIILSFIPVLWRLTWSHV
jgi:hypothetical protein